MVGDEGVTQNNSCQGEVSLWFKSVMLLKKARLHYIIQLILINPHNRKNLQ